MYRRAKGPTPILNTPDFLDVFGKKALSLDDQGLLRAVEMVALPGTLFKVLKIHDGEILEVVTRDYPGGPYFIDARFTEKSSDGERERNLPGSQKIVAKLQASLGLPYIWGGNWGGGIPELGTWYGAEPSRFLAGVDCSGLLYEATNGCTPRNTSELLCFGKEVPSIEQLKPLDLLVWKGHVIIALTPDTVIESLLGKGVITTSLEKRWAEIAKHKPVIRRFLRLKK